MDLSVSQFTNVAKSNWLNNDIVLDKTGTELKSQFFHSKSSNATSNATNRATMNAFLNALVQEYGVFGANAFKQVLETRAFNGQSLRKSDILNTVKMAETDRARTESGISALAESKLHELVKTDSAFQHISDATKERLVAATLKDLDGILQTHDSSHTLAEDALANGDKFLDTLRELASDRLGRMENYAEHFLYEESSATTFYKDGVKPEAPAEEPSSLDDSFFNE